MRVAAAVREKKEADAKAEKVVKDAEASGIQWPVDSVVSRVPMLGPGVQGDWWSDVELSSRHPGLKYQCLPLRAETLHDPRESCLTRGFQAKVTKGFLDVLGDGRRSETFGEEKRRKEAEEAEARAALRAEPPALLLMPCRLWEHAAGKRWAEQEAKWARV